MAHSFDKDYWEEHWEPSDTSAREGVDSNAPNPSLVTATTGLAPGTALDAGCGTGGEAIWLAEHGWQVTAADISTSALAQASRNATKASVSDRVRWVEADLTTWEPGDRFDLVTTFYAHPTIPQLAFYRRIAEWVAPGGALLIVGHTHDDGSAGDDHPPAKATAALADITDGLDADGWRIDTAEERARPGPDGHDRPLHDVIVRATRRS